MMMEAEENLADTKTSLQAQQTALLDHKTMMSTMEPEIMTTIVKAEAESSDSLITKEAPKGTAMRYLQDTYPEDL